MKRNTIAMALAKKNVNELVFFIRYIVKKMTGNTNFSTPTPALSDLSAVAKKLEEAQQKKKVLGIANRNEKRRAAESLLNRAALYVARESEGDAAIIESSGMPVKRDGTPVSLPGEVRNPKVEDGVEQGEVRVRHRGTGGRNNIYYIQYNFDPALNEKNWVSIDPTGKLRVLIQKLQSGRKVAFRVRAHNTAGFGPWSPVIFRTIQ